MVVETERFGDIDLNDNKVIEFPAGLPGFEDLHKYILLETDETKPLYWLQSIEDKYISLPVIIPFEFVEDYCLEIRDYELQELNIQSQNDLLIMNVVVIPEDLTKMTTNLAAPVIVNARDGVGKQIIIDAKEMPIRFPIYEAIMKKLKGGEKDAGAVQENR
ncbi:flagellar assembly protein FliW [Clostridia bacterium OttesenSCG-928-F22]|nr:flagellar assembly protein FliW [Clostridia bacterium OttesenSCG-928-F22]